MSKNLNLLVLFLKAKGFNVDAYSNPDFIYIRYNNLEVGINLRISEVCSISEQYCIRYGETNIDKICRQLKENEKKYIEFIEEIKSYISMNENDMKRYIVEHIDEVEF